MARRGRKPGPVKVEARTFSFKLDLNNPAEREFRRFLDEEIEKVDFSLREYLNRMWNYHHGQIPSQANDVADAIREATQGLWDMFQELIQNGGATISRENFQRFAQDRGVDEFDEDFVNGMLDTFGKLDDDE